MYKNACIYAIRSFQTDDIYIGSTCNDIKTRFRSHKGAYNSWLKGKYAYYASFELLQYDDAYVELVEKYPCNDKRELEKREGEIIRETENCINKQVAGRTMEEYYYYQKENNTEVYKKQLEKSREYSKKQYDNKTDEEKKEYYEENKDTILKKAKEKYKNNYNNIKEKQKDYQKQYYEEHKEKITCICGVVCRKADIKKHERSKKHLSFISQNNNIE